MTVLPQIPVRDFREGGITDYARVHAAEAAQVLDTVLDGMGIAGRALRPALPVADRIAGRWLRRVGDPYLPDILDIRAALARPGPVFFSLSYEFGCTARAFRGAPPVLFRTLDWPFHGLGERVEIVRLSSAFGDWITATWPGVVGVLQGAAPGRFAAALNQAPEWRTGFGRPVDWLASKRRFLRSRGLPPPHLLRQVFETAPDYATAKEMLMTAPVAAPVIFTLAGTGPDDCIAIERDDTSTAVAELPAAANHFTNLAAKGRWRPRGYDSAGRLAAIGAATAPPEITGLVPPILNPLTRLAVSISADGCLEVAGYDAAGPVTKATRACA